MSSASPLSSLVGMGVRCYFLGVAVLFFAASPVICGVDAASDKKKGGGFLGRVVSSGRKLLQLGVTDDSRLVPPIFVDWADPGTQPRYSPCGPPVLIPAQQKSWCSSVSHSLSLLSCGCPVFPLQVDTTARIAETGHSRGRQPPRFSRPLPGRHWMESSAMSMQREA